MKYTKLTAILFIALLSTISAEKKAEYTAISRQYSQKKAAIDNKYGELSLKKTEKAASMRRKELSQLKQDFYTETGSISPFPEPLTYSGLTPADVETTSDYTCISLDSDYSDTLGKWIDTWAVIIYGRKTTANGTFNTAYAYICQGDEFNWYNQYNFNEQNLPPYSTSRIYNEYSSPFKIDTMELFMADETNMNSQVEKDHQWQLTPQCEKTLNNASEIIISGNYITGDQKGYVYKLKYNFYNKGDIWDDLNPEIKENNAFIINHNYPINTESPPIQGNLISIFNLILTD